jgi:hypothetical protein
MKFSKKGKVLMVLAMVAVLGIAVTSFAGWGRGHWGSGSGMMGPGYGMMGPGYGMHRGWSDGSGYYGSLNNEEIAKLDKERTAFFEETRELRQKLYQKELELRSELAKSEPDAKKAADIQKEVSEIEGQLDQKRIDHSLQMRRNFPKFSAGGYGFGQRGMGMGRGMYGQGGGPCSY